MARLSWGFLVCAVLTACGAPSYQQALGYRARQAVIEGRYEAFDDLMAEAAKTEARSPLNDPRRTVLVHFFDFAADPRFSDTVATWMGAGWVDEAMTCALEHALWVALSKRDPARAEQAVQVCLARARNAAEDVTRGWEVDACLKDAPFLTRSSTLAEALFLDLVNAPHEPLAVRQALLQGLALRPLLPPSAPLDVIESAASRMDRILGAIAELNVGWVGGATAVAAARIERRMVPLGRSYFGRHPRWAWAWVRTMKARPKDLDLAPLGLWREETEGKRDAFWFACPSSPYEVDVFRRPSPKPAPCMVPPQPLETTALAVLAETSTTPWSVRTRDVKR